MSVDTLVSEEQAAIVRSVVQVLEREFTLAQAHRSGGAHLGPDTWRHVADLGWTSVGLSEAHGGLGMTICEDVLVHQALGEHLVSPSVLATTIALRLAADAERADIASALSEGRTHAAFALRRNEADRGQVYLIDASDAGFVVVVGGLELALVDAAVLGLREPLDSLDPTVGLEATTLDASASFIATSRDLVADLDLLVAAHLCGLALAANAMAVDYAKLRHQFGRPIGAFQAISHMAANGAMRAEAALQQTRFASIAARDGRRDARFQTAAASLLAAEAAFKNATDNIQIHGGMGFSAEAHPHLVLKRAVLMQHLIGNGEVQRATLMSDAAGLE